MYLLLCVIFLSIRETYELTRIPLKIRNDLNNGVLKNYFMKISDNLFPEYLTNFMNSQYYGTVKVGDPPQEFNFMFDTGSSDVWIISKTCAWTSLPCLIHWNKYDHVTSNSYKEDGQKCVIPYVQGNVSVFLSQDTMKLGDLIVNQHTFGEAYYLPMTFVGVMFDGIIGLGFRELSVFKKNPFLYNAFQQNTQLQQIFSIFLGKNQDTKSDDIGGELMFGGYDSNYFHGSLHTLKVIGNLYWRVKLDKISVSDITQCKFRCSAVIDTGTSAIIGPVTDVQQINERLGATFTKFGLFSKFDCNNLDQLQNVTFALGGRDYNLTKDDYVLKIGPVCVSAFIGNNLSSHFGKIWILGDTFIRKYYTVFNMKNRTISFAEANHNRKDQVLFINST